MTAFLVALAAGLAIGFVIGGVWVTWARLRFEAKLHDRWSHHGGGPPQDDEEDRANEAH